MNKIEYWFLDAAITAKIPFHWLSASNVDEMLNRPHHALTRPELLGVLERMFTRGHLFLEYTNRRDQSHQTHVPTRSEIAAALALPPGEWTNQSEWASYGVTASGGELWETVSHPQWNYFYEELYDVNPHRGEMTASTRGFIEERLTLIRYDPFIKAIVPESVQWSVLKPWQATYWKQLPTGHHVEFRYLPLTEAEKPARSTPPDRVRAWHQRVRGWYTNYF
jgi:hypothetical protein